MESEPHKQLDLYNRMPVVMGGASPHLLPESHLRPSLFQLSSQNDRIIGVPVGHSFKDVETDRVVCYDGLVSRNDGLVSRNNLNYQELCFGGTGFESGSLGTLPASRGCPDNAVDPLQDVDSESLRAMYSNGGSYASSSLVPASPNCGYDGLVGEINNKWDHNRFLMQPELNRSSTSGMDSFQFSEARNETDWGLPNLNVSSSHGFGHSRSHNELSLSLATSGPSIQCSDMNYSGIIHSSQSQLRLTSEHSSRHSQHNKELSLGCSSILSTEIVPSSRYRSVLQQILTEISTFSLESVDETSFSDVGSFMNSSSHPRFPSNQLSDPHNPFKGAIESCDDDGSMDSPTGYSHTKHEQSKKSQLLSLLQVVDDRYNQCLDQIHTVVSAFHAATELDPQLHACFARQSVSFFYKNLRERITNRILAMGTEGEGGRDSRRLFEKSLIQKQWALEQLKKKDQQLWRPQRGLPEKSVSVLRAWMFDNFLHPYPKDAEKHLLAIKSGLARSQVSNWFINARVRLWKPMVEEMCAEMNRRKGGRHLDYEQDNDDNRSSQLSIHDFNQRLGY